MHAPSPELLSAALTASVPEELGLSASSCCSWLLVQERLVLPNRITMQSAYLKWKIGFQPVYCLETARGTAVKFLHYKVTCCLVRTFICIKNWLKPTLLTICRYQINIVKVLNKYQVRNYYHYYYHHHHHYYFLLCHLSSKTMILVLWRTEEIILNSQVTVNLHTDNMHVMYQVSHYFKISSAFQNRCRHMCWW